MGAPGRNAAAETLREARLGTLMTDAYPILCRGHRRRRDERPGRSVTPGDRDNAPGGAARPTEFAPAFRARLAHLWQGLDPRLAEGLTLPASLFDTVVPGAAPRSGSRPSPPGPKGSPPPMPRVGGTAHPHSPHPRPARRHAAPGPGRGGDLVALSRIGLALRGMGAAAFREVLRIAPINVADLIEDDLT